MSSYITWVLLTKYTSLKFPVEGALTPVTIFWLPQRLFHQFLSLRNCAGP